MSFYKRYKIKKLINVILYINILSLEFCPIIKSIYQFETNNPDTISRKESQKIVRDSLSLYLYNCADEIRRTGIVVSWEPMLSAKPCSEGYLSLNNTSIVYCYEKLFLDKSNIQSCSLLLMAGSCSDTTWQTEMAVSYKYCQDTLKLENYTTLFKVF
jgi:hypothetical protein